MKSKERTSTQKLMLELYQQKWNNPNLTFRELLKTLYIDKKLTIREIADMHELSPGTVHNWLKKEGIVTRKMIWV